MKLTDYINNAEVGKNNVSAIMGGHRNKRVVISTEKGMVDLSLICPKHDHSFRLKTAFDKSSHQNVDEIIADVEALFGKGFVDMKWDKAIAEVIDKPDTLHNRRIVFRAGFSTFYSIRYNKE